MVVLNATVGGSTANAYNTAAGIDTILEEERVYSTEWTALDADDQDRVSIWATRLLDTCFDFCGAPSSSTQALRFPRVGLRDEDGKWYASDALPNRLLQAHAELCLFVAKGDRTKEAGLLGKGISSVKVDVIEVAFDSGNLLDLIPFSVVALMATLGNLKPTATQGGGFVRLRRS